jgi:inhibitor of cysteine peptidase
MVESESTAYATRGCSMNRVRFGAAVSFFIVLALSLSITGGCGTSKQAMQEFVDGYLRVMEELESKPEVAQAGQAAAQAYAQSGYTDLESAEKARLSYVESSKNDAAALADLEKVSAPDDKAERIKDQLTEGVTEVDKGNKMFSEGLANAKDQTVEQRAAAATDIAEPMSLYVKGMTTIVDSLAGLQDYVKENDLEGSAVVTKWYERIKSELETVKQYAPPDKSADDKEPGNVTGESKVVKVGEDLTIELESNPTTGYEWKMTTKPDASILGLTTDTYEAPTSSLAGAPGKRIFRFKALKAGKTTIVFENSRSWEKDEPPAQTHTVAVEVQ